MACGMDEFLVLRVVIKRSDDLLVDGDGKHFFLFKLVLMTFVTLDDSESFFVIKTYLRGHEKDFGEEVLLVEDTVVVRRLDVAFHNNKESIIKKVRINDGSITL
jgi:hypothetical protein